jgi:hypothetical protein
MTFITTVKIVGQAMFKINCGEGSVAKSRHKGNGTNHIPGLLGKHREHCAYIPTLQSLQYGPRQFRLDGETKHLNPFRMSESDANDC